MYEDDLVIINDGANGGADKNTSDILIYPQDELSRADISKHIHVRAS